MSTGGKPEFKFRGSGPRGKATDLGSKDAGRKYVGFSVCVIGFRVQGSA